MADYSYMNTPKVKTQNKQMQGGQQPTGKTQPLTPTTNANNQNRRGTSTLQEMGGAGRTLTTYDQPMTTAGTAQLPPARDTSNPYANIQQPNQNPASGYAIPENNMTRDSNLNQQGGSQWNLGQWNPSTQTSNFTTQGQPAPTPGGGSQNFWDSVNPWNLNAKDPNDVNQVNTLLPVAQFDQNNYQYSNDFAEAQRRWNAEFGLTSGQNQFQQSLSARQQMSAEEQARLAASQWNQQFGHTQQMDVAGLGLSQQQINNQFTQGMDQNQASRDVANTYGNAQMYGADQQLAGNRYQADQQLAGQLGSAGMYSDAQRYQAQLGLQGQQYQADRGLDVANTYAGAQNYGADQQLAGQLGSANIYAGAQNYGADQQLAGQLGSAGMYSDAQRYQALLAMQGQLGSAGIYSGAQMYGTDAQERMNAALMANNLAVANMQAYGRSQPVQANWARNWG